MTIKIYTDGACRGNPGPGGWAFCCLNPLFEQSGFENQTTNNRMELKAMIEFLKQTDQEKQYIVYTDSQYVYKGIMNWRHSWKKNGWKNSKKKQIENLDLWKWLDELVECRTNIDYQWIRGHNGDEGNEKADLLANEAITKNSLKQ